MNAFHKHPTGLRGGWWVRVALSLCAAMLASIAVFRSIAVCEPNELLLIRDPEHRRCKAEAGVYLHWPWQTCHVVDARPRLLSLPAIPVVTQDGQRILLSSQACWKIIPAHVERFLQQEPMAINKLTSICSDAVADWAGTIRWTELLSLLGSDAGHDRGTGVTLRSYSVVTTTASLGVELLSLELVAIALQPEHASDSATVLSAAITNQTQHKLEQAARESQRLIDQTRDECRQMLGRATRLVRQIKGEAAGQAGKVRLEAAARFADQARVVQELEHYGQLLGVGPSVILLKPSTEMMALLHGPATRPAPLPAPTTTGPAPLP